MVERFVELVDRDAPRRRARDQDDRRRGDGRRDGSERRWWTGPSASRSCTTERPLPRIGLHAARVLYRDGDYYGRAVNLAARVGARATGGEVLVTREVRAVAGRHLAFQPIGEVKLKGFDEATELFLAARDERADERGEASPRRDVGVPTGCSPVPSWCSSRAGATRCACSTSRCGSPGRWSRCTSTTGCATRRTPTRRTAGRCASGSSVPLRGASGRATPRGNVQAWAREVRYARGGAARGRDRRRPHGHRPGRDRALPARRLARAARAARDAGAVGARDPAAARADARGDGGVLRGPRAAVARGRDQRGHPRAGGSARSWPCTRRRRRTCAHAGAAARRGRGARHAVDAARTPTSTTLPPALARLIAAADRRRRAPIARTCDAILALARKGGTASLDLPGGLRATSEYGRVTIERGAAARRGAGAARLLPVPGESRSAAARSSCELGAFAIADGTLDAAALASDAGGARVAGRGPDAPARAGRHEVAAGPVHRPQGPARAAAPAARRGLRRRDRVGPGRRHRRAVPRARRKTHGPVWRPGA